ncbi:MAG: DNA polymerase III subunit gamma/tau [Myxococcota bacterium]|nr:DNA polymerase III subunit gamma/tau [Myxococcota bacterium]
MSYQVIARKWRPQGFDEVIGQSHVTTALRNVIRTGHVPHALLLTGPRGVGKTTLARILARSLNCDNGPTDSPCGTCSACEDITEGRSTDVQEVDAASRTGVDDIRELIDSIQYAPAPGKHRIFVVDEVHMLSKPAFNALLKTLEEPPPNSLFVFATTNPEKIPVTVLSRCQRYDLRRIRLSDVAKQLEKISKAEGIQLSNSSLMNIAREGEGSMRDSQTLLDQLVSYGGDELSDETVAEVLDLIDRRVLLAICEACIASDAAAALDACARAAESGNDPTQLASALVGLLRDLVVISIAPDADLVEGGDAEIAELAEIASKTNTTTLRRMFRALVKEHEYLAWAPQPYAVLEMAIVRLATMPAGDDVMRLLSRLDALEKQVSDGGSGTPGGGGESARPVAQPAPKRGAKPRGRAQSAPVADTAPAEERGTPGAARATETPRPEAAAESKQEETPVPDPANDAPLPVIFDRLRQFAQKENRGAFASLEGGRLIARRNGYLELEAQSTFHAKRLRDRTGALEEICESFFGTPTRVEVRNPDGQAQQPTVAASTTTSKRRQSESEAASQREKERKVRQAALQHPSVNTALEVLEASIVDIQPIGRGGDASS